MKSIITRTAALAALILMLVTGTVPGQSRHSQRPTTTTGSVDGTPQTRASESSGEDLSTKTTGELWRLVENARQSALPRSAAKILTEIYRRTSAAGDWPQALKARVMQITVEAHVSENRLPTQIQLLNQFISKIPSIQRPLLDVVLADWYWQYYQDNWCRIMDRQPTSAVDDADFTTWDQSRIFREIDTHYQKALAAADQLQQIPVTEWLDFLGKGNLPLPQRPTLFDFVAWEALAFYTSDEQTYSMSEDSVEPTADSPILANVTDFLAWQPTAADIASTIHRTLVIYQSLLAFHRHDENPDAFLDADIHRLHWARNVTIGEDTDKRYRRRLAEIADAWPASPLSALARYYRADSLFDARDRVAALAIARKGAETFPHSRGGLSCQALTARITAREFALTHASSIIPGRSSRLRITYRNLTRLHFRVFRRSLEKMLEQVFQPPTENVLETLRAQTPVLSWSTELAPTTDYHLRTVGVDVPALEPGIYWILASQRADFADAENKIQIGSIEVSTLATMVYTLSDWGVGYVVDRASGVPISGATVILQTRELETRTGQDFRPVVTAGDGRFTLPPIPGENQHYLVITTADGRTLWPCLIPWGNDESKSDPSFKRTVFFTDRAIYRPGQMIRFKGICARVDQNNASYRALKSQPVTVSFRDTTDREITRLDLVTNEYGSFSGTVIIPTDRLTGEMHLVTSDPQGSTSIRVEDYKLPRFDVRIYTPVRAWRLGDHVELTGSALGYAGAPVDGATVRYRIYRFTTLPPWLSERDSSPPDRGKEITHGKTHTGPDGTFIIPFIAEPDFRVPASSQPISTYHVSVDVTDSAGQTCSITVRIPLNYSALEARVSAPEWLTTDTAIPLTVQVNNMQGSPQVVQGTLEVFRLRGPERPIPEDILGIPPSFRNGATTNQTAEWHRWPTGERVLSRTVQTAGKDSPVAVAELSLTAGAYLARYTVRNETGQPVTAECPLMVIDPAARHFPVPVPDYFVAQSDEAHPGEVFTAVWGTGYDRGPVRVDVYADERLLQGSWQGHDTSQVTIRIPVTAALRGGFTVITTFVKDNHCYTHQCHVNVPWSDHQLKLQWQSFRSRLEPGRPERWSLRITGPEAAPQAAELVATLYDASLDTFIKHDFDTLHSLFLQDRTFIFEDFDNIPFPFWTRIDTLNRPEFKIPAGYIHFPGWLIDKTEDYTTIHTATPEHSSDWDDGIKVTYETVAEITPVATVSREGELSAEYNEDSSTKRDHPLIQARRNLTETAFFLPQLRSDADGAVTIDFTAPEALTRWRFLAFAHTPDLCWGTLEASAVTRKELMVQPNPPRFLREGDELELTVKVTNMADSPARGSARLTLFDPRTDEPLDAALGNTAPDTAIDIPAHRSRTLSWRITVPDGLQVVGYRAVAATSSHSDGEEGVLPVLSRRIPLREALSLHVTGPGSETFSFDALRAGADAPGRHNLSLTVQMTSNPAWYAVMSLPYLMEFPYECNEQLFHRLYANALARHLATAQPRLRRIFDQWKGTAALDSPLDKNEALTGVQLRETPWVRDAGDERRARQMVGALFDATRLDTELTAAYRKLALSQLHDGSWPWFPGGRGDTFITLTVVTGFGRLARMGIGFGNLENPGPDDVPAEALTKALQYLDTRITDRYRRLHSGDDPDANHLSDIAALYLYGRSFFLRDHPLDARTTEAVAYFRTQAVRYWPTLDSRRSQAHLALALERFGDREPALAIMRSLKERSITSPEMGRHWPEPTTPWYWADAPIETQALLIEAFDEVSYDTRAVDECRVWLLKQKQTRHWGTTTATADAVYALLHHGTEWLADTGRVTVRLDGIEAVPDSVEAGTGFWEVQLDPATITPALADVTVTRTGPGIAWGGVHWQYLEDIARVTAPAGTPLTLSKTLFVRRDTERGPVIEPVDGPLAVGDRVTVRLVLRVDRDMDYVHLKDLRGSGLEPENVLSGYRYQDGLGYYESTRDTAGHFFIDHLPRGTYVFEYPLRVSLRGHYQTGVATVECMYAPVFAAHSASTELTVK